MSVTKRTWINKDGSKGVGWQIYVCFQGLRLRWLVSSRQAAVHIENELQREIMTKTFAIEFYTKTVADLVYTALPLIRAEANEGREMEDSTYRQLEGTCLNYILCDRARYDVDGKRQYLNRMVPWSKKSALGNYKLVELRPHVINNFIRDLEKAGASFQQRSRALYHLSVLFKFAINTLGWASHNPTQGVEVRRRKDEYVGKLEMPQQDHIDLMMSVANSLQKIMLQTTCLTGVRVGELLALKWENVDTENHKITVHFAINESNERVTTKTEAGMREVVISDGLAELLDEFRSNSEFAEEHDFVFSWKGTNFRHSTFYRNIVEPLIRAARKLHEAKPELHPSIPASFTWKSLRHWAISTWMNMDLEEIVVYTMAGHAGPESIHKTYGHIVRDKEKVEAMNSLFERQFGTSRAEVSI